MTGCVTVADVLAIAPDPRAVSQSELRRRFGVGFARAKALKQLAIDTARVHMVMREHRMSEVEAVAFIAYCDRRQREEAGC